jgi:thiol-disulfide isomerase/thioredoxin
MVAETPARLDLVYATWCPHCVPVSTEAAPRLARKLNVPLRLLDIDDREMERVADRLVEAHGDWTEDYLIPQVFLEWSGGRIQHLLTGTPGSVAATRSSWEHLLTGDARSIAAEEAPCR